MKNFLFYYILLFVLFILLIPLTTYAEPPVTMSIGDPFQSPTGAILFPIEVTISRAGCEFNSLFNYESSFEVVNGTAADIPPRPGGGPDDPCEALSSIILTNMVFVPMDITKTVTITLKSHLWKFICETDSCPSVSATWYPPETSTPDPEPSEPDPEPSEPDPDPIVITPVQSGEKGQIVFSEIMFEPGDGKDRLPQWIEVYNTSDEPINLRGWQLSWKIMYRNLVEVTTEFTRDFFILPKETALIVSSAAEETSNKYLNVYNLFIDNFGDLDFYFANHVDNIITPDGFFLMMTDANGTEIDRIGNLKNGEKSWEFPDCSNNRSRSSMIRRFDRDVVRDGTERRGWIRAYDVKNFKKLGEHYYGATTDKGTPGYRSMGIPLPVELSVFTVFVIDGRTVIEWTTESEIDNAGFNIYRSETRTGAFQQVNTKLIKGAGTIGERNAYTWTDTTAKPNVEYYYRIEDVSFAGNRQMLATKRAKGIISVKNRFITQWSKLKAR